MKVSRLMFFLGLVPWLSLMVSTLPAQESAWTALLAEADQGDKSLAEIIAIRPRDVAITSESDFLAIAQWISQLDIDAPNPSSNSIANYETCLRLLVEFELSEHLLIDSLGVQRAIEKQLDRILRLDSDALKPLELVAMNSLRYLLMTKSSNSERLLLDIAENKRLQQSAYWSTIAYVIPQKSPVCRSLIIRILRGEWMGRVSVSMIEFQNAQTFNDANYPHFLNHSKGSEIVRQWLSPDLSNEMQAFGAPKAAAISLAFLQSPDWFELVRLACEHPDMNVVLEGAWAGARRADDASIERLVKLAQDVRYSNTAVDYLRELSLESRIPSAIENPDFAARAELAKWLSYPTEKGRPPDSLEIIDNRRMTWPLEDAPVNVYLIQFSYKDPTGGAKDEVDIGFVGPMTFCHYDMKMSDRPKEDIYAIHVFRELESYDLIESVDLAQQPGAFDYLLATWKKEPLEAPEIIAVAKLQPSVEYPRRLIALAKAKLAGEEGYVVLDGPRSKWCPKKDRLADTPETTLLMIHLGRQLLGF